MFKTHITFSARSRLTRTHGLFMLAVFLLSIIVVPGDDAFAQQQSGCFAGRDYLGYPAKAFVNVERYGDWFQIHGQIYSSGTNTAYRFSVDGHSGAGRLYQRHEYESGAIYMDILNLTETEFLFELESYGKFLFKRTQCR